MMVFNCLILHILEKCYYSVLYCHRANITSQGLVQRFSDKVISPMRLARDPKRLLFLRVE